MDASNGNGGKGSCSEGQDTHSGPVQTVVPAGTILLVDADQYLTELLRYALVREGFEVMAVDTGGEALNILRVEKIDLVLFDVEIPDADGFDLLSALRAFSQVPVVILTARAHDKDVIAGFEEGADDYMAKPFNMQVLVSRVKAVLRRTRPRVTQAARSAQTYRLPGAVFDPRVNEIIGPSMRIRLTRTEGRILHLLMQHRGQVLSPEYIMERVWGYESETDVTVIKTHIRHLREKIARLPNNPRPIRTLSGVGYMVQYGEKAEHAEKAAPSREREATA